MSPSATAQSATKPPKSKPSIAPQGGRCLINTVLPTELLSYIFELGTSWDGADSWDIDTNSDEEDEDEGKPLEETDDGMVSSGSDSDWHTEDSEDDGESLRDQKWPEEQDIEKTLEFQVLVSHVCKRWREVALGNPSLWSTLEFYGSETLEKNQIYLERSKNAPLVISVDCSIDEEEMLLAGDDPLSDMETAKEDPLYKALEELFKLLQPHTSRWRELEVMVSHYPLMQLTLETLASCPAAPLLQTLQLYFYEDSGEETHFQPPEYRQQDFVIFHGDAPKLTNVALWGVHLDWTRSTFLSGLTELELAYHTLDTRPSYRDFLRMLETSPALRCLSLCQSGPAGMPVDWLDAVTEGAQGGAAAGEPPLSITLHLPNLVLAFLPPDYLIALLDRISLPNLVSLALDFEDDDYTSFLERITSPSAGCKRSLFAGLEALKLSGIPTRGIDVLSKAYSQLQKLTALNINFNHVDLLWCKFLSRPEDVEPNIATAKTIYCPRLEILSLSGLEGRTVRRLVEERMRRGYPLKQVHMNEADDLEPEDQKWLEDNLETLSFFEGSDDEDEEVVIGMDGDSDFDGMSDMDEDAFEDEEDEWTDEED